MTTRLELHEKLCDLLGSRNVYFQPPEKLKMSYPCIRYSFYNVYNQHADNSPYHQRDAYQLIVIDPNPDGDTKDKVKKLPLCAFDRYYAADNLNHYVYTIYC